MSGPLAIYWALCVVLFEPQKLRKLVAMMAGYVDGRFGVLGTFESAHPRIAAFCNRTARKEILIRDNSSATAE